MLNYKPVILIIFLAAISTLTGCRSPNYIFNTKVLISDSIRKNISGIITPGNKDTTVSYSAFKATISEKLVDNNAVADYKLVNDLSKKKKIDIVVKRYRNELYFYVFKSDQDEEFGLFLSATFDASNNCIGVGPVYIGFIGLGDNNSRKFVTEQEYSVKKMRGADILYLKKLKRAPKLVFSYEQILGPGREAQIRFFEVMLNRENKISGINKSLVFDVEKIFNDPDALRFLITNNQ